MPPSPPLLRSRPAPETASWPRFSRGLIAAGGLAGMTSVLLVLFLSQARIFMAMSRDGLLPQVFGTVHPRFRTPHMATMVTGVVICVTAAFTPIYKLEEMVNIGTLMAFVMVCAAVLGPAASNGLPPNGPSAARRSGSWPRLGILINVMMMLFFPWTPGCGWWSGWWWDW